MYGLPYKDPANRVDDSGRREVKYKIYTRVIFQKGLIVLFNDRYYSELIYQYTESDLFGYGPYK